MMVTMIHPPFPIPFEWITNTEIKRQYDVAKNHEGEMYDNDFVEGEFLHSKMRSTTD
jgi:hypothetical protein